MKSKINFKLKEKKLSNLKFLFFFLFLFILVSSIVAYSAGRNPSDYFTEGRVVYNSLRGNVVPYGEINGTHIGEVSIGSQDVYYNVSNTSAGYVNGFTYDESSTGELTAEYAGIYLIMSQWSFSGTASNEYHLSLRKNGVPQTFKCHAERVIGTGGDVGSASYTCRLALDVGDTVVPVIENTDSAGNPTIHDIQFEIDWVDYL